LRREGCARLWTKARHVTAGWFAIPGIIASLRT
jgi:hypothetical protein